MIYYFYNFLNKTNDQIYFKKSTATIIKIWSEYLF
jgi:hypothetical protein